MAAVAHPSRSAMRRNSPLSGFGPNGFSADAPMIKRIDVGNDSDSDDEPPPAIKFSKVTQALLADAGVPSSPPRQPQGSDMPRFNRSTSAGTAGLDTPSRAPGLKVVRRSSPPTAHDQQGRGTTPQRVVHLGSSKGPTSAKRSTSVSGPYQYRTTKRDPTPETHVRPEIVTPAPAPRAIRVVTRSRAGSNASQDDPGQHVASASRPGSRNGFRAVPDTNERMNYRSDLARSTSTQIAPDATSRYGASTAARSRNISAEAAVPPGSTRIKRAPMTGSFLKSGPIRRGFKRRDSEENGSANEDAPHGSSSQPSAASYTPQDRSTPRLEDARSRSGSVNGRATSVEPVSVHDFAHRSQPSQESRPPSRQARPQFSRSHISNESGSASRQTSRDTSRNRQPSIERYQMRRQPSSQHMNGSTLGGQQRRPSVSHGPQEHPLEQNNGSRAPGYARANYRYDVPKPHGDAYEDQENMPPPTFRRNKDQDFKYLGKPTMSVMSDDEKPGRTHVEETPVVVSQQEPRRALGAISGNTPHRVAPAPPPKMSVLDAATATAGASTTKTRKKRNHIVVKGKIFTQMGRIGKGGSSEVYCVMAENYKTFALKRVKLEDCDETAVRGYKGEIDLLKKLTDVERVVRLYDWELNDEKKELFVLMEKGDTDFNRILTLRLNGTEARFDSVFTRYHWKEMLECVQAVHDHDIVHSDLKPANFLLVQGRLKLIDFGIANAIDTDNTCNVHRDSHVGTPNYMSPESITDTNASGRDEAGRPLKKDMRIGKASDVWSLGCILYQMAYGRPPFAHIGNQISRIMAITNPKHVIEFPEYGVGDAPIPSTLRGILRRCLNRDPGKRPLIKDMLSENDAYLNPEGTGNAVLMDEALLGQIINKVLDRCRDPNRGIPSADEAQLYPKSFMTKIREMQEGR
ncbi:Serine/threonine-protein kinase mph1 [Cercospora beticola]|uniref:Serine/threonine-protein kinase mph1 n=2 Tax=Cercospora beticola TaxID=122368 RepID=A0A2G5IB22_CERBT|nr:Serine/threonine-protein kinase mph1 [Cercospora beticola]PIB02056.1 Serine/threonine-protein kinase mph1 [Cercospora beticola]